jgi:hypothetical protein
MNGPWQRATVLRWAAPLLIWSASCATGPQPNRRLPNAAAAASERGSNTPAVVGPPVSPESDPANVERRFGFAEAKARRERDAEKAAASATQQTIEPVAGNAATSTPAMTLPEPAAATPAAPAHDHNHGAASTRDASMMSMCPCHAAMNHKTTDPK